MLHHLRMLGITTKLREMPIISEFIQITLYFKLCLGPHFNRLQGLHKAQLHPIKPTTRLKPKFIVRKEI
jgi:hypothetical protein